MRWCDADPTVVEWDYECLWIPYYNPIDDKVHRYLVDFKITMKLKDNTILTYLIEVKPSKQMLRPDKLKYKSKAKYIADANTYVVNTQKRLACQEYCKKHSMLYKIISEFDLFSSPSKR